jgi:hypothetical protein
MHHACDDERKRIEEDLDGILGTDRRASRDDTPVDMKLGSVS